MFYLQCNRCNHLNEVKSEYQVMCEKCGAKMKNTYAQWKISRPNGTFDSYLAECCISKDRLNEQQQAASKIEQEKRKTYTIAWILGAVAIVFIGLTAAFYGKAITEVFSQWLRTSNGMVWTYQEVGTEGLELNFPKTFEETDAIANHMPPAAKAHFSKIETHIAGFNKEFIALAITMVTTEPDSGNLKNYAQMGLSIMGNTPNAQEYTTQEYQINGYPAILLKGTYPVDNKSRGFQLVLTGSGTNYWMVLVIYPGHDNDAERIADRLIKSTRIKRD
ncbi:MAG TPA: hypothetical protein VMW01_11190 [Williamwhitmania sp.]|nr:hypothetical protein [Williamwhitmania sp.]